MEFTEDRGSRCIYKQISRRKGRKFYLNRRICFESYKNQRILANFGLAPKVYSLGVIPYSSDLCFCRDTLTGNPKYIWFYETEHVRSLKRNWELYNKKCRKFEENVQLVMGGDNEDLHNLNCGIKNGKLVVVDCDPRTFGQNNIKLHEYYTRIG